MKLALWFWRRFFFYFVIIFSFFCYYSLWKKLWSFIWKNLNSLDPWMLCSKYGWNWPNDSGEGFFKFFIILSFFCLLLLSPLGKRCGPSFEQIEIPSLNDALYHVWLKWAQWFWRSRKECEKFTITMKTDNGQLITCAFRRGELTRRDIFKEYMERINQSQARKISHS